MKSKQSKSRADRVRAKRKNGSKASAPKRVRKQQSSGRGNPPVMVRGTQMAGKSKRPKKKNKRVKRRYDVALPTPGVEVRLPSVPTVKFGWRLLSTLLALLLFAVLYYVFNSPIYRVREVQFEGLARFSTEAIGRTLYVYNKPIFFVEPEKVEKQIVSIFPGIVSASVQVGFPARVDITIEERKPVLIWDQGTTTQWVDSQGIAFPERGEAGTLVRVVATSSPPAPIVLEDESTIEGEDALKALMYPEMVEAILSLNLKVPEGAALVFDGAHGFGWHDPQGWVVYFGSDTTTSDMDMKLAIYEAAIQQLRGEGIQPAMVSVEYLHAPYYRLEH